MVTLGLELSNRPLSNYFGGKCFMSNAAFRSNKRPNRPYANPAVKRLRPRARLHARLTRQIQSA